MSCDSLSDLTTPLYPSAPQENKGAASPSLPRRKSRYFLSLPHAFTQMFLPAKPYPHTILKGNYFLWALANVRQNTLGGRHLNPKFGSHQSVSSFISTWSKTLGESEIEVPDALLPPIGHVYETSMRNPGISVSVSSEASRLCARTTAKSTYWVAPACFGKGK